jgi:site-specific DNA recombinase
LGLPKTEQAIRPEAVAIYVRWSTEEQGEGTTLQEQLERCKSYVVSQGWRVNDSLIFVDDGYSGATLRRPAMTELRRLITKGQVDCVVSLKIDRLSRSLVDCVDLVLREWAGICHYKSVSQPVNTTDELSRVFFAILAGFAEYERALIRERTFSGLLRRVKEGNFWGSGKAPYGYTRVGTGKLAINPDEAAVVRMIFRMAAADRLGPGAITSRLNDDGIPSPEGKGWWMYTVRNLLRNRIYIGYLEYGKRYVDHRSGSKRLRKRSAPLVEPTARVQELVLVSDEEFEAVQRLLADLKERAATRGEGARSSHPLTGILKCRCGGAMITGYDRLNRRFYMCQFRDKSRGGGVCTVSGGYLYAHQIEPVVVEEVKRRFADPEANMAHVKERMKRDRAAGAEDVESLRRQLEEVGRREERLQEDASRLVRQARRGEITLAEKREFEIDIEAERQELAEQRATLQRRMQELEAQEHESEALLAWVSRVDQWDELPPETQKELLRHLIDRMVAFKPKGRGQVPEVDFYWRV